MPENLMDRVDAALDRGAALDRYLRRIHTDDHTEPHSDRQSTGQLKRLAMDRTAQIVYGRVVDAIAYHHWYKVQPDGGKTTIPCCMLSGTALTPFGVREHNQLHPNAGVYLLLYPGSPYGVIIGVEPKHLHDGTRGLSDYVSMCSAHTPQTEQVHNFPFSLPKNGSVVNWSSGRPVDGTCAGEWGMFAESGVSVFIDSAMAFVKADENTGVWAFYRDQMVRLSGRNVQIRATGGWEVEALDDQGEFNHVSAYTPYPWEALGAYTLGTDPHREVSAKDRQVTTPHYAAWEPAHDDQMPFFRTRHYHGYAGQGGKRVVTAPPAKATGVSRYSVPENPIGLFEESISQAGVWTVRTAKGLRIIKRHLIPVAKAMRRPEDTGGDTDANYKAAGRQGNGPEHKANADLPAGGPDPQLTRCLGQVDLATYSSNWEAYLGFHPHSKDYHVAEESALKTATGIPGVATIPFDRLKTDTFLPLPTPGKVKVDHRYGDVDVYPTYSYFDLLDDGGVLVGDGSGSEIRMAGGSISLAPAGDLILQPGRRLVIMAGTDVEVRAQNSVDISTTKQDVRIASGRNLEIGAEGGILVESKSTDLDWSGWVDNIGDDVRQNGIHLKAAKSAVCTWSDLLYMRTGIGGTGTGIRLDAGQGAGTVAVNCDSMQTWARTEISDCLGGGASVQATFVQTVGNTLVGNPVTVSGSITAAGTILADGWLMSTTGHISTALAEQYDGKAATLKDQSLAEAQQSVADVQTSGTDAKRSGSGAYSQIWDEALYATGGCGEAATIAQIGYSFRTPEQYGTLDYRLYEARWQQMARLWGMESSGWTERSTIKSGRKTSPFPGLERLTEAAFYRQDLTLFDTATGVAKDRTDAAYTDPKLAEPQAVPLNGNYLTV